MSAAERKVVVVPCSGIGKTYGTVSREAAYEVTEDLRPGDTRARGPVAARARRRGRPGRGRGRTRP